MRREAETVLEPGSPWTGRECTACRRPLLAGDRAVICPRCRSPHHSACWAGHGGCARPGCRQLAVTVVAPRTEAPGPGPAPSGRHRAVLLFGLLAVLAAVVTFGSVPLWRNRAPVSSPEALRLMAWASLEEADRLQAAVDAFNRARPADRVRLDLAPYVAYEQKLIILMAAGDPPDLFLLPPDRVPLYASQGALLDLAPVLRDLPGELREGVSPADLEAFRQGDRIWGLPYPLSPGALAVLASTRRPELAVEVALYLLRELPRPSPGP